MSEPLNYATPSLTVGKRSRRGLIGWLLFVGLAALLFVWLKQSSVDLAAIPLSTFYAEVHKSNVAHVEIDGDEITGQFRSAVSVGGVNLWTFRTALPPGLSGNWTFVQWLLDNSGGADVRIEQTNSLLVNFILPFIPWLLILGFIWFFVFRRLRGTQTGQRPIRVVVVNPEEQ